MVSGILKVSKPRGLSSHDIVRIVRTKLKNTKVGHAGTLDPEAEGLLIVLLGKTCKRSQEFIKLPKVYEFEILFGFSTPTLDLEGISREFALKRASKSIDFSEKQLKNILKKFIGGYKQEIPIFSAKKVKGVSLYKLARSHKKNIKTYTKTVKIYNLTLLSFTPPVAKIRLECSSGTYVRSLVIDISKKLNTRAVTLSIMRTKIGAHNLQNALKLDQLKSEKELKNKVINI